MESETPDIHLLRTKLYRPPVPAGHVHRPQLEARFNKNLDRPLTLVTAPAGYGKSTLVSCWLEKSSRPSAWLSLDEADNDLQLFLSYFIAAVQTIIPEAGSETADLIDTPNLPPTSTLLVTFLNELDRVASPFIVVLDDIQRLHRQSIYDFLSGMLQHPPQSMQLILVGRRDPRLPIAAMRANGLLSEFRMRDLLFTADEAFELLQMTLGSQGTQAMADEWTQKTEGWVTGIRLAALAIRGRNLSSQELLPLHGDTRYVMDYLVSEVLENLPPGIRNLLLNTSILQRFCAPLCEALGTAHGIPQKDDDTGEAFIKFLRENNLFVISLDTENRWFRYHHLFEELLKRQLQTHKQPDEIAGLHIAAADWFASQGLITESIEQALSAGDTERASQAIETYRDQEFIADRWFVVNRWLAMLPADIKQQRPKLLLTEAWIANLQHQMERVPILLQRAETLLHEQTADPSLLGELSFFHGYVVYWEGQAERCIQYNEEAIAKLSGTKSPFLGEAELMLGVARCMAGQTEKAVRVLNRRIKAIDSSEGQLISRLIAGLAFIHLICGNLSQARLKARRLQQIAETFNMRLTRAWSAYMRACANLHAGDFESAMGHFAEAEARRYALEPMAALDAMVGLALTQQLKGLNFDATETIHRMAVFTKELNAPQYISMVHSCEARIALLRGNLASAIKKAHMIQDTPTPGNLFMWLESPPITKARVLIAQGSPESLDSANRLLGDIRQQSESYRFTCQTIEVAVLQAMALGKQGHRDQALAVLEEVVALAGPLGWIRPFVEADPVITRLLTRLHAKNIAIDHIEKLLAVLGDRGQAAAIKSSDDPAASFYNPPIATTAPQPLLEPLSNRELDVLELLAGRLQNKEIAEKLCIAPSTVKAHLRSIYQKLDVDSRQKAVARATALGILAHR